MGWFVPKLAPGERVVWRNPKAEPWLQWVYAVGVVAAITAALLAVMLWIGWPDYIRLAIGQAAGAGVMMLAVILTHHQWRVVLTDRRLLVRPMAFWHGPREIPLHELEPIDPALAGGLVKARGGGQEIGLPLAPEELVELAHAVETASAAPT